MEMNKNEITIFTCKCGQTMIKKACQDCQKFFNLPLYNHHLYKRCLNCLDKHILAIYTDIIKEEFFNEKSQY